MATTMLRLLGVFLFIFATSTQLNVLTNFSVDKTQGKWYLTGLATSNKWFSDNVWMTKMSVSILKPTCDGDVHVHSSVMDDKDKSCLRLYVFVKKTNIPGNFVLYSNPFTFMSELSVLDVKYDEYVIIQKKWNTSTGVVIMNKLYTRKTEVSPKVKQKFVFLSKLHPYTSEKISFLPLKGECV